MSQKLRRSHRYRQRSKLGLLGETVAVSYLQNKHFRILERNFRARYGEIDIIALDGPTLVFIEVKTRSGYSYGVPEASVTQRKLREVIRTGQYYALLHPKASKILRVDVVAIVLDPITSDVRHLRHIPNVTL